MLCWHIILPLGENYEIGALFALLLLLMGSSLFFGATASAGSITEFYSDATYSHLVGVRGWGACRAFYGITTDYSQTGNCF